MHPFLEHKEKWRFLLEFQQNELALKKVKLGGHFIKSRKKNINQAALSIQQFWRKFRLKQEISKNPYDFHVSMLDKQDKTSIASAIMFGRHIAEIKKISNYRIHNPYIRDKAYYYRMDELHETLLKELLPQFSIRHHDDFNYLAVNMMSVLFLEELLIKLLVSETGNLPCLAVLSVAEYRALKDKNSIKGIIIVKHPMAALGMLIIPKCLRLSIKIKLRLTGYGLLASAWMIASLIDNQIFLDFPGSLKKSSIPKEDLLKGDVFDKLLSISKNPKYSTHILAKCLVEILRKMPLVSASAIYRIAVILDLTLTFHANHYPKFSFCVYSIIHEMTLGLMHQPDELMEQGFSDFESECESNFAHYLGLNEVNLKNSTRVCLPALSGANAFGLALELAKKISKTPKITIFKPCYYEFEYFIDNADEQDADVLLISAGPIVSVEGVWGGLELNAFIHKHILNIHRAKPVALIVDCTTALYKNLKLDEKVIKALKDGLFSIFFFESHQKFGLLHSDQAQYGRVFAICSNLAYPKVFLNQYRQWALADFKAYVDMRIGAFLNYTCLDLLEDVKRQHFANGALLQKMISKLLLKQERCLEYGEIHTSEHELYFVSSRDQAIQEATRHIEFRDSFGHFSASRVVLGAQLRISPDASDLIDSLILASQCYLAYHLDAEYIVTFVMQNPLVHVELSQEQQITILAMLHYISQVYHAFYHELPYGFYPVAFALVKKLEWVKNNKFYQETLAFLYELNGYQTIQAILQKNNIDFCTEELKKLLKNKLLCNIIIKLKQIAIDDVFFKQLRQLSDCKLKEINHNIEAISLIKQWQKQGMVLQSEVILTFLCQDGLSGLDYKIPSKYLYIVQALNSVGYEYQDYVDVVDDQIFAQGVMRIHIEHLNYLSYFKEDKTTLEKAIKMSEAYRKLCYFSLKAYCRKDISNVELLKNLDAANQDYLNQIETFSPSIYWVLKLILMSIVNFIAALTLGVAHYINYKINHRVLFWPKDKEHEDGIKLTHTSVCRNIIENEVYVQQVGL